MWQTWKTLQDASTPGCPSIKHRHWHLPTMPQGARCEYLPCRDVSYWLPGDINGSGAQLWEVISDHPPITSTSRGDFVGTDLSTCACTGPRVFAWSYLFFKEIYYPSVLCKPTASHLPTLYSPDTRHWIDNVRFQHQEGKPLLQYLISYFCFLQHFPDALLVLFCVVRTSISFFSHSTRLFSFCSSHHHIYPLFHGCM